MKRIPIWNINKKIIRWAIVDDEKYLAIKDYRWTLDSHGYVKTTPIPMAMMIMGRSTNKIIDHINGNPLDNRLKNLRFVTYSQNNFNRKPRKKASKYKGVSRTKTKNVRWTARIKFKEKELYLGSFGTQKEAAIAYDTEARKLFGEFAWLNFPKLFKKY